MPDTRNVSESEELIYKKKILLATEIEKRASAKAIEVSEEQNHTDTHEIYRDYQKFHCNDVSRFKGRCSLSARIN